MVTEAEVPIVRRVVGSSNSVPDAAVVGTATVALLVAMKVFGAAVVVMPTVADDPVVGVVVMNVVAPLVLSITFAPVVVVAPVVVSGPAAVAGPAVVALTPGHLCAMES